MADSCGERRPPGACEDRASPAAASWRITAKIGEPARRSKRARHSAISSLGFLALRIWPRFGRSVRSEEHTSELQSRFDLVCRLLLEKKKKKNKKIINNKE